MIADREMLHMMAIREIRKVADDKSLKAEEKCDRFRVILKNLSAMLERTEKHVG